MEFQWQEELSVFISFCVCQWFLPLCHAGLLVSICLLGFYFYLYLYFSFIYLFIYWHKMVKIDSKYELRFPASLGLSVRTLHVPVSGYCCSSGFAAGNVVHVSPMTEPKSKCKTKTISWRGHAETDGAVWCNHQKFLPKPCQLLFPWGSNYQLFS